MLLGGSNMRNKIAPLLLTVCVAFAFSSCAQQNGGKAAGSVHGNGTSVISARRSAPSLPSKTSASGSAPAAASHEVTDSQYIKYSGYISGIADGFCIRTGCMAMSILGKTLITSKDILGFDYGLNPRYNPMYDDPQNQKYVFRVYCKSWRNITNAYDSSRGYGILASVGDQKISDITGASYSDHVYSGPGHDTNNTMYFEANDDTLPLLYPKK